MHIISWNINGISSFISKGGIQKLIDLHVDIICLQEIIPLNFLNAHFKLIYINYIKINL